MGGVGRWREGFRFESVFVYVINRRVNGYNKFGEFCVTVGPVISTASASILA